MESNSKCLVNKLVVNSESSNETVEEKKQEKRKGERKSHQSKTYLLMEAENIHPLP